MSSKETESKPAVNQTPATKTAEKPAAENRPKRQPRYNVILIDDDQHSYEYVIDLAQRLFGHPRERGMQIAEAVDNEKRAVLLTTHLEHAELKQEQIHGFGPDKLIASCQGAMTAVLEPVPEP